jgi:hypothetical protein
MKTSTILGFLVILNGALIVTLLWRASPLSPSEEPTIIGQLKEAETSSTDNLETPRNRTTSGLPRELASITPLTPFAAIYSDDPAQLVANLRRVGCPEGTVRDILIADVDRKYRAQEEMLRPTPADHVPWGWSAKTSEGKLIERRQQAAAIARQKEAVLRGALGYDVPVKMAVYAMTTSEQRFQEGLDSLTREQRQAAQQIQGDYWAGVQALRELTAGFWQSDDIAELERLRTERNSALNELNLSRSSTP